jgi:hypothetical protein
MLFDISLQPAVYNERIAIILGLVTLVLALAIFASCRTFVSLLQRLGLENPSQNKFYQGFYKYHLYYWWGFGVSLLAHVMMVTLHTGLPKSGDPDAGVHWVILILGLASAVSGVVLFFSCRILPRLLAPKTYLPLVDFRPFRDRAFYIQLCSRRCLARNGVTRRQKTILSIIIAPNRIAI